MRPFKKYVTSIMVFFTPLTFVKLIKFFLSLPLSYSIKTRSYGMKEKKIFCIYGWFSVSRYIEEGRKSLCRRNWIYKHTCMYEQPTLTKQWNYSIFVNLLYSYFKYTNRLFLGCVLFVGCCSIIWASRETKKERLSYRKRYSERGLYALLSMSFFLLSLSTHSPFPSDVLAEWPL